MICRRPIFALLCLLTAVSLSGVAQTAQPPARHASKPDPDAQLYRNAAFGFRYQIPFGWVDRTQDMREPDAPDSLGAGDSSSKSAADARTSAKEKSASQGEVLLAVFERPPDAPGDTVNCAVVIASENASTYPGLKKAEDYLGPLTELTTAKGFKADGDPSIARVDGHELVRSDFIKPLTDNLAMYQTTLILITKGKILSFTFIAGSGDEVDDLIDSLHFAAARAK